MSDLITGQVDRLEYLGIESLEDAVFELQKLEASVMESFKGIRQEQKALIRKRWKQGQIVHLVSEDASYGDGAVNRLAQAVGVSESTMYECRSFYLLDDFGRSFTKLNQWLDDQAERRSLSWSYCRNLAAKRLPEGDPEKKEIEKEKLVRRIERRSENLEHDFEDLVDHPDPEVSGAASKAIEVARDTRRQIQETMADPKDERVVDDKYRAFVRQHRCAVCQEHPTDPAHLPVPGMKGLSTKVADFFCIPLCREHHTEFDQNRRVFYQRYDVPLFQICAFLIVEYFTGIPTTAN